LNSLQNDKITEPSKLTVCLLGYFLTSKGRMLQIEDNTGKFTPAELKEIVNFIVNDLLSNNLDIDWLGVIRIREDARSGYEGYWKFKLHLDAENKIDGIVAVIVLNYYYVKFLEPQQRLDALKTVLAHEYGHHWTLSYLTVYQSLDVWNERMPSEYYQIRGLNNQDYAHNYSQGWNKCDKEIIAEDYRSLFSPAPYNENHQMGTSCGGTLEPPNQEVKTYINNLNKFQ